MKKQFLLIGLLGATTFVNAQSFPNGGFENWTDYTIYEEPQSWSSMNLLSLFGAEATTQKTSDSYSGSFALALTTSVSDMGDDGTMDTIPGIIMLGNVDMSSGTGTAGQAFTHRPDSIVGWYKLTSPTNSPFMLQFSATKWDANAQSAESIADVVYMGNAASNYVRFSIAIDYLSSDSPDTIQVYLTNSMNDSGVDNVLLIDDLSFVYNSTASVNELESSLNIAPNPVNNELTLKSNERMHQIVIQDLNGQIIYQSDIQQLQTKINTETFSPGIYLCSVTFENGSVSQQKIIKN